MKILYILINLFLSLSCVSSSQKAPLSEKDVNSNWTDNFILLRAAIIAGDKNAVKAFIDFPILNKKNEIWYIADSRFATTISPKEIKPFTEADFDEYFSSIFAMDLRKTLEELDLEEFFKSGKGSSPEMDGLQNSKDKLEAHYDKITNKLTLTLLTYSPEFAEFAVIYEFDVTADQKIKFRQVYVRV